MPICHTKSPTEKPAAARHPNLRKRLLPTAVPVTWPMKICRMDSVRIDDTQTKNTGLAQMIKTAFSRERASTEILVMKKRKWQSKCD